jgi:hypothetical protein
MLAVETAGLKPMTPEQRRDVGALLGGKFVGRVFYNTQNIIFDSLSDYELVVALNGRTKKQGMPIVAQVALPRFEIQLWVMSHLNCPDVRKELVKESADGN